MKRLISVLNMLLKNVPDSRQLLKHINVLLKHTGLLKCYFKTQMMRRDLTLFEDAIHQTAKLTSDTDEVKVLLQQT